MFLEKFDAAQAHRETYVAVIKSVLREPGAKQALAEKLGRKPQHLSNMLNPGTNAETYTRTPNPRTSERLVALLPLEPEVRASLLEHLYRAWEGERGALRPYTYTSGRALTHYTIADLLGEIGQAHVEATHAVDPTEAKRKYRVLRHACKRVLERIDPDPARVDSDDLDFNANPLEFAQVCLFVHDVQCVFNRADDALVHAKYARGVMDACDPTRFRKRGEYFGHLRVNAVVAECLAYRNLGLHREAIAASYEAEALVEETGGAGAEFWLPDICLHRLNALIRTPRFTLSDVRGLVGRAEREYEGRARRAGRAGRAAEPHLRWRVQLLEGEARAYLEYGAQRGTRPAVERAGRLLQSTVERVERADKLDLEPVHRSRLLRTYASVQWQLGALDSWAHYLRLALALALDAGLDHQLAEAEREYGEAAAPMLAELKGGVVSGC